MFLVDLTKAFIFQCFGIHKLLAVNRGFSSLFFLYCKVCSRFGSIILHLVLLNKIQYHQCYTGIVASKPLKLLYTPSSRSLHFVNFPEFFNENYCFAL